MSEWRKVEWKDLGRIEEDRVEKITPMMKSGGRKKKKARNPWESSASELEKDEGQEKRAWVKRFVCGAR